MNQTIKERLIAFISYLNIGQGKFEKNCGLANAYVANIRKSISPEKLQKIAQRYPELNTGWLMTGEGEMLKQNISQTSHGDYSPNVFGDNNAVADSSLLSKALDEISEMRKALTESLTVNQRNTDRLITIIEQLNAK